MTQHALLILIDDNLYYKKPQHAFMQTSINTKSLHKNRPLKPIQIFCCHQKFAVSKLLHLIAGGHVNPAVSLAMVVLGKLPLKKFPVYVAAQFIGAFAGSCAVFCLYYGKFAGHFYFLVSVIGSSYTQGRLLKSLLKV